MKKLGKQALAAKALKIKEDIKLPQMRFTQGKNSKEDDSQKDVSKEIESKAEEPQNTYRAENSQRNLYQTGAMPGSTYGAETSGRNLYQTGAISGNSYRAGASQRNLSQTGMLSGNMYRTENHQRNIYQTGVISGGAYRTETSQRNLYQTETISEDAFQTKKPQRNIYQTGVISRKAYGMQTPRKNPGQAGTVNNIYPIEDVQRNMRQTGMISNSAYSMDSPQRNHRRKEAGQGTVRRTRSVYGEQYSSENSQEKVRRTETAQRNRRQTGQEQETVQRKSASQRNRRQADSLRRNGYQAGQSAKAAPRTTLLGGAAAYIKIALAAVLVLFIVFDLSNEPDSSAQIETVAENVVKAAGLQSSEPAEARMVKRFYGLNPKDYEGAVLYAPVDNMDAHEMFLVKLKDDTQKKTVEDAIEERLDTQLKSFEGYGAEQTALLEKHVLSVKGNYVLYIVGEYAQEAQEAFAESL